MRARALVVIAVGSTAARAECVGSPEPSATRGSLAWILGDDDVLHSAGELSPPSPAPSMGDRSGYRDSLERTSARDSDRESLARLGFHVGAPGFERRVSTEAEVALRADLSALARQESRVSDVVEDAGSNVRVALAFDDCRRSELSAALYPIDSDRFRLGHLWGLTWGGTSVRRGESIFPRASGGVPAARVGFDAPSFGVFVGVKTASTSEPAALGTSGEASETRYGALAGIRIEPVDALRVDFDGGWFEQGRFEAPGLEDAEATTAGATTRLMVHAGSPPDRPLDWISHEGDPDLPVALLAPRPDRARATRWLASAEGTLLAQRLAGEGPAAATAVQPARAAAVIAAFGSGRLDTAAMAVWRDAAFVLRNGPGFVPYRALSSESISRADLLVALATDVRLGRHVTPGLSVALRVPASLETAGGVAVLETPSEVVLLPPGEARLPVAEGRVVVRWDLSRAVSAAGWVQYRRDANRTRLLRTAEGTFAARTFESPDFLGIAGAVRATF